MTKNITDFVTKCPENYYFVDNEWWYYRPTSRHKTDRQRAESFHDINKKRMYVNGKYISYLHPLYKPGRYKNFEQAAFSSLERYELSKEGQVYVITNPNFPEWVKVGMAVDAEDRLNSYQTSSPFRDYTLVSAWSVTDRRTAESEAHQELHKLYDRRSEWFRCTAEQAKEVCAKTAENHK